MSRLLYTTLLITFVWAPTIAAQDFHLSRDGFITEFLLLDPVSDSGADDRDWQETLAVDHLIPGDLEPGPHLGSEQLIDRRRWERVRERSRFLTRTWRHLRSTSPEVDIEPERRSVAFLFAGLDLTEAFDGWILLGCDDELAVWIDGVRLDVPTFPGWMTRDQHWVPLRLAPGRHELFLKTYNERGRWAVSTRFLSRDLRTPQGFRLVIPGLEEEVEAALLEQVEVDLTPVVTEAGLSFRFSLDLAASRPIRGAVICARALGSQRCIPSEALAGAPRSFEVLAPESDFESVELNLAAGLGADEVTRTVTWDVIPHREAVSAIRGAESLIDIWAADGVAAPAGSVASFEYETQRLEDLLAHRDLDRGYLRELAAELARLTAAFQNGTDPYLNRTGHYLRAYRGTIDGRLQPYAVYVPDDYRPSERLPLVVSLRGLGSPIEMNLRQVLGFDRDEEERVDHAIRNYPRIEDRSAIFMSPYGYGDTLFRFMGEVDVLAAMEEAQTAFGTDADRVYLTGLSMGGIGSFDFAVHYSDRFAAVLALAGTADLRRYTELRRHPSYAWELALADEYSATRYARNAVNLPILAVHGTEDGTHYSHSEDFIDELLGLGYEASLELPNLRHNVWRTTYADNGLLNRLGSYRRTDFPASVRLTTPSYRYAQQHWLRITHMERVHEYSSVAADFSRRRGSRRLNVESEGVFGISLALQAAPQRWREDDLEIQIDGQVVCETDCWQDLEFWRSSASNWSRGASPTEPARLTGPLQDMWYGPMIVVYGTQQASWTPFLRTVAHRLAEMGRRVDIRLPVVADDELTPEQARSSSLILVGDRTNHSVIARYASELPIDVTAGRVRIGSTVIEDENLTVQFVYPNPEFTSNYMAIYTGTGAPGYDALRFSPRFLPDFVVYGPEIRRNMPDRRTFMGAPVRAGGFFLTDWSLPPPQEWLDPATVD